MAGHGVFQFHKVRLKVERGWFEPCLAVVSIPQGTIKSPNQPGQRNGDFQVSIPQGTIKRACVGRG